MTTEDRVAVLEGKIDALQTKHAALRQHLTEAQLEQWHARIDDLEVQIHLASMAANDRLMPILDRLRAIWLDARTQLEGGTETATSIAETLHIRIDSAYRELRTAMIEARSEGSS
jgi:hypothetical protein